MVLNRSLHTVATVRAGGRSRVLAIRQLVRSHLDSRVSRRYIETRVYIPTHLHTHTHVQIHVYDKYNVCTGTRTYHYFNDRLKKRIESDSIETNWNIRAYMIMYISIKKK